MSNNPLKDIHEHFNFDWPEYPIKDSGICVYGVDWTKGQFQNAELKAAVDEYLAKKERCEESVRSFRDLVEKTWTLDDILCYQPGRRQRLLVWEDRSADRYPWVISFPTERTLRVFEVTMLGLQTSAYYCMGACSALGIFIDAKDEHLLLGRCVNLTKTIAELKSALKAHDFQADDALAEIQCGVSFLVSDRKRVRTANSKRGKNNYQKAVRDDDERQRAERDVQKALSRVHERVTKGPETVATACRWVCSHFETLTDAKKNKTYLPLAKADGKPLKPETLARYYRERYKTRRGKK